MKILIVEDSRGQSILIHKIIQKNGSHEVLICEDAFEAFATIKAVSSFDVVILDNQLPYVSGMDLLRKIKNTKSLASTPVLICTADKDYESFKSLGADACLHKPFTSDKLFEALNQLKAKAIQGHS
jgi:two-component system autoinducer 2 sensor kinase/phosphatase LuxQ